MAERKRKNKPGAGGVRAGAGRKTQGRERRNILMLPAAWKRLENELRGPGDSLGKVIERKFGVIPPPE